MADLIGSIANISLGCLFVATMYQIAQSIKIIKDPLLFDFDRMQCHKYIVFTSAAIASFIFCVALSYVEYHYNTQEGTITYLIVLSTAYLLMTAVYSITLLDLRRSMKGLLEQDIATESTSVQNQFTLFLLSYTTRFLYFVAEMAIFNELQYNNFIWQLTNCLMYIPWNVLPIFYILYCHQRTYEEIL